MHGRAASVPLITKRDLGGHGFSTSPPKPFWIIKIVVRAMHFGGVLGAFRPFSFCPLVAVDKGFSVKNTEIVAGN